MAGTKGSCCNRFCCFSSSASDEEGQDHPASAGPRSSPSAIVNTTETLPGPPKRSEVPIAVSSDVVAPRKDEIEQHVDPNLDVSRTHQCDKAPLSESQNILRKSEGEDVNAHPNVSGATQCDEPSSPGSSNLPVKSEGEHVDVNPNVSEAPSSSFSTGVTKSDVIRRIKHIDQADGEKVDVNLDELVDHICQLLKLREEMLPSKKASNPSNFHWPDVPGFKKSNAILSWGTDLKNLKELVSSGLDIASTLKDVISGLDTTILEDIGQASVVTAGLLVVAYTLERFHDLSHNKGDLFHNKDGCWVLIREMSRLASVVKRLNESRMGTLNVIEEATALVVEGAITCRTQLGRSGWESSMLAAKDKADLSGITQKLRFMYLKVSIDIGNSNSTAIERVLDAIEPKRNPPVGIEDSIKEVFNLLECESDQKAVTVIIHGFGGMGKTTLADAVFSHVGGCRYSHVQLFENINSKPNIIELQKKILKDLMGPEEPVPHIRQYQEGQRELGERLEKMEAFIYIDNVLEGAALKELLPQDMRTAKRVRLLLTARNANVKDACPRSSKEPKIYKIGGIQHQEALIILKREIEDGLNDSQFNDIIHTCGGIPLMLTVAAASIGRADNKETAYATLMEQKENCTGVEFEEMRYVFAYHAIPSDCKEPFLDICTYFNGWKWDRVEDIVGKSELRTIENRALVGKTTEGFASVHDVILRLARGMSKEESKDKEVRCKFTNASELKKFLEEGGTEGIRGIWLTERKDVTKEEEEDDDDRKEVVVQASALDKFHKSLRVLQLGNSIKVEGNCNEIFKELVFLEAKISQLPFDDVSQLPQLRYLSYDPPNWVPSSLPSSLAIMNFNGKTFQTYK